MDMLSRFSKTSNLILLSLSLPGLQTNVLSGASKQWYMHGMGYLSWKIIIGHTMHAHSGNHTFAAVCVQECYETLSVGLKVVMDSINAVIGTASITLDDITYQLEFILGGDLKVIKPVETCSNTHIILLLQNLQFLLMMMGLNEAHCLCMVSCALQGYFLLEPTRPSFSSQEGSVHLPTY